MALIAATPGVSQAKPDVSTLKAAPITVDARPLAKFNRGGAGPELAGDIQFRGGLVLTSPSQNFGGWSGLVVDDQVKSFAAISDSGVWLTGTITYDGTKPTGIAGARMGPLLTPQGSPIARGVDRDSESIALETGTLTNGTVLVSFERRHRIARFGISADGLTPQQGELRLPSETRRMRRNQGIEAVTVMKGGAERGAVLAFSERLYDSAHNHTGWFLRRGGAQTVHLKNVGDFDITDLATLEDGTIFVLERRFRWLEGVKMRVVRLRPGELRPGQTAEGETLIEADLESEIDNMEGLAATRLKDGRVLLTIISDDNFNSVLQRTLLLQFEVGGAKQALGGK